MKQAVLLATFNNKSRYKISMKTLNSITSLIETTTRVFPMESTFKTLPVQKIIDYVLVKKRNRSRKRNPKE